MRIGRKERVLLICLSTAALLFTVLKHAEKTGPDSFPFNADAGIQTTTALLDPATPVQLDNWELPTHAGDRIPSSRESNSENPPETMPGSKEREGRNAVVEMLHDSSFLDVSSNPSAASSQALEQLVKQGGSVIDAEVSEAVADRVAAGLYIRLPGYSRGSEFRIPNRDNSLFGNYVFTESGDALQVDLSPGEYPYLYELYELVTLLQAELEGRRKDDHRDG